MPKRRRLLINDLNGDVVFAARGRLKGALMEALNSDEDSSNEEASGKNERHKSHSNVRRDLNSELSIDRRGSGRKSGVAGHKSNSYVMKLFDRSVDLAQFGEDTPLYPICRAWMANQPKTYGRPKSPERNPEEDLEKLVGLHPPEGPPVPKVPPLLPEQCQFLQEEINFDYRIHTPPSMDHLMELHKMRWGAIRRKWHRQSALYEGRYAMSHAMLKEMDSNI